MSKKKHAKLFAVTPDNVARNAQPRHKKRTKAEKKLAARVRDYEHASATTWNKSPNGAYHKPGSLQQ